MNSDKATTTGFYRSIDKFIEDIVERSGSTLRVLRAGNDKLHISLMKDSNKAFFITNEFVLHSSVDPVDVCLNMIDEIDESQLMITSEELYPRE